MDKTLLNIVNPDSESISKKEQIDMSVSLFDVSASGHDGSIVTDYANISQTVIIPEPNLVSGSVYYTPLYKEKLDYNVWLTTINKNFEELD